MCCDLQDRVKHLLIIGVTLFLVGLLGRVMGHGNLNPIMGILTPGAFHRAADTFIFLAIGLALFNIGNSLAAKDTTCQPATAEKNEEKS
jgi:hypothetical protein